MYGQYRLMNFSRTCLAAVLPSVRMMLFERLAEPTYKAVVPTEYRFGDESAGEKAVRSVVKSRTEKGMEFPKGIAGSGEICSLGFV